jgi:Immunoglobulin domain
VFGFSNLSTPLFTNQIKIKNLTAEDSGKYICQINFDPSNVVKKEVDLQVTRASVILDAGDNLVSVAEGQSATLHCKADGYPKPEVNWRRENDELLARGFKSR